MTPRSTRLRELARTLWGDALTLALGLTLSACGSLPKPVSVDFVEPNTAQPIAAAPVASQAATGSLFKKVSYRPAFEDPRARVIGDVITIRIVETVAASQVSKSTANRTTSGAASISAFPMCCASRAPLTHAWCSRAT
jgi:flagellar L-ring protein precursor FlgH